MMDTKQWIRFLAIAFVIYFCIALFLQFIKLRYAWPILSNPTQFKICVVLAALTQFALLAVALMGVIGAPGLYHFKRWGRHLICTALIANIGVFLLKSVARFWPNLICNYVKESAAPYMDTQEAFVYDYILFHPSPMMTMITFLATCGLLYFFSQPSSVRLFSD